MELRANCTRSHIDCIGCPWERVEPPKCTGHGAGPSACQQRPDRDTFAKPAPGHGWDFKKPRPSWDAYFLNIAREVAKRSVCLRHQVGAVIVRNKRILTTGYNGPPSGIQHCADRGGCLREKENIPSGTRLDEDYALHAEMNAILQAALHGVSTEGATLYCTHAPCSVCAKAIINAGIVKVVSCTHYPSPLAIELLKEAEVERVWPWEEK